MKSIINQSFDLIEAKKLKRKKELQVLRKIPVREDWEKFHFSLELQEFVRERMFDLEMDEFTVLYLRFWKEFNVEDISKLLGMDQEEVRNCINIGSNELKKKYVKEFSKWKENLKARMLQI